MPRCIVDPHLFYDFIFVYVREYRYLEGLNRREDDNFC